MPIRDDVPIETYLSLLAQVAPPARDGAEAYMTAFRSRCGRPLTTRRTAPRVRRRQRRPDADAHDPRITTEGHGGPAAPRRRHRLPTELKCNVARILLLACALA